MYLLVADWEEAGDKADAVLAKIEALQGADMQVPDTLWEALATAENDVLIAAEALHRHQPGRSPGIVLHQQLALAPMNIVPAQRLGSFLVDAHATKVHGVLH